MIWLFSAMIEHSAYHENLKFIITIMFHLNDALSVQVKSNSYKTILKAILSANIPKITVPDAAKAFNNYLFLDAREPEEYNVSHIFNARFAGYKNFNISSMEAMDKKEHLLFTVLLSSAAIISLKN